MVLRDKLNNKNLLNDFGLIIRTGTAELLVFPERKERLVNDWAEENGKEYDLENPKMQDKEVTLSCAFIADNDAEFWANYDAFFEEITKKGWQDLFIFDHTKTYKVFYKNTGNFEKVPKRLKAVEKVFVTFELTLVVQ